MSAEIDEAPPTLEPDYACEICGTELVYAGRGRKPTRCSEHKRKPGETAKAQPKSSGKLAGPAADTLVLLNNTVITAMYFTGMPETASQLASRQEGFREASYNALLADEALCRSILGAGQASAKIALVIAYATMIGGVAPYATAELKGRKDARKARATDASSA